MKVFELGSTLLIEVIGAWKIFFVKSDTIAKSAPRFTIVTQDQINLDKHSEILFSFKPCMTERKIWSEFI